MKSDPCCWIFYERDRDGQIVYVNDTPYTDEDGEKADTRPAKVIGIIGAHVDDFLLCGQDGNTQWEQIVEQVWKAFRWSPWEQWCFMQTGLQVRQNPKTFEIELDQKEYLYSVEEIDVSAERRKQREAPITEKERTLLRGLLGDLQWLCTQTNMEHMSRNWLTTVNCDKSHSRNSAECKQCFTEGPSPSRNFQLEDI